RVLSSYGFVKTCLEYAADNKERIRRLVADADKANTAAPADARIALRHTTTPLGEKSTVLGLQGGKTIHTGAKPVEYKLDVVYKTEATLTVARAYAYVLPASFKGAVENLQRHGVEVEQLSEDVDVNVQVYRVDKIKAAKPFQKHSLLTVDATMRQEK